MESGVRARVGGEVACCFGDADAEGGGGWRAEGSRKVREKYSTTWLEWEDIFLWGFDLLFDLAKRIRMQ